jgi:hypothetical protein
MSKYGMTTATFRKFKEPGETSSGLPIEAFYLHPLLFMTPADSTEVSMGSLVKLQRSTIFVQIIGPATTSGRFRAFPVQKARF